MKSFKSLVSEVSQPKPEEEKRFKDQHKVDIAPHPTATEFQHKGTVKPKAKRKADQEGDSNYDAAYGVNEEAEELDEISRDTARSYIRKAAVSGDRKKGIEMAGKKAYSIPSEPKVRATESVDLEEDIAKMSHGRLKFHMNTGTPHGSYSKDEMKSERDRRLKGGDGEAYRKAKAGLSEAEELDEISKKTLASYVKKATGDAVTKAYKAGDVRDKDSGKNYMKALGRQIGISKATSKLTKEEAEQLDELSPNKLHSYIKKATGQLASKSRDLGDIENRRGTPEADRVRKKLNRKISNRSSGIVSASGRLADKANMSENWQEEIPMMMRQLEFIAYAAEEIMDYVETAGDPEEWFQNKISGIHQSMLSMYAYAQGGRRAGYGFDESVELDEAMTKAQQRALQSAKAQPKEKVSLKKAPWEKNEELKGGQKKLDHNKNGKIDAHDFKLMRSKKMKEDLDEAKDDVDAKWLVTWRKEQSAGKYIDASAFFPTEREARDYKGRLKSTRGVLRNSPEMKKIKQTEADKRALAKESVDLDELSKDTLRSYARKASQQNHDLRKTNDGLAARQLYKRKDADQQRLDKRTINRNDQKIGKRSTGISTAIDRLAKESFDLDEAAPKMKPDFLKTQREKDRAHDAAMGRTPTGRKKPERQMTSTQRSLASMRKEEVESLDEAFKQGIVKLKDGSSVAIKKEDADLLNQMFKDLSSTNRKKMQEVAMKDKSGFEEILGFAREAL